MTRDDAPTRREPASKRETNRPACPVCGGLTTEIRAKLVCASCHTTCETCCDGGRAG